jgi:hypothetical protein
LLLAGWAGSRTEVAAALAAAETGGIAMLKVLIWVHHRT